MQNELYQKMELALFRGETERGLALAREVFAGLDLDDDEDMVLLADLLQRAVFQTGSAGLAAELSDCGLDWNLPLQHGQSAALLFAVSGCRSMEVYRVMAAGGADWYAAGHDGRTALHLYAAAEKSPYSADYEEIALAFFEAAGKPENFWRTDAYGALPLHYAVLQDKAELALEMLRRGADPNAAGSAPYGGYSHSIRFEGVTPLMLACRQGKEELGALLLEHGANPAQTDNHGRTAASYAVQAPNELFCRGWSGAVPEKLAVCRRKGKLLEMLPCIDLPDDGGVTPLLLALGQQDLFLGELALPLLTQGAGKDAADHRGVTALMYAAANGHSNALKALCAAGAALNAQDAEGRTALHHAVQWRRAREARFLLKKGARFDLADNEGRTAAELAVQWGAQEVLELML